MSNFSTEHRKLAAIMFTDMVGYSALSQRNEALALELIAEHQQVLRAIFPKHQGTEIKSTGDGFLVEFASALAAVQCAVEIQKTMRDRNASRSAEGRVMIRIGIHLGDVVRREKDVFGDGVNIAARIEPLAEPGGICVSRAVYEQIANKIAHPLVQLPKPTLKNIQATVEVYRLVVDEIRTEAAPPPPARSRGVLAGTIVLAVAVVGVFAFLMLRNKPGTSTSEAPKAATNTVAPNVASAPQTVTAELRVLHSFGPGNKEGVNGWGPVRLGSDGFLYGCTLKLGPGNSGGIYRIRTNGADYSVLHSFDATKEGAEPTGGILEAKDGNLYGTTYRGGAQDAGVIFRMSKDGSDFRVLRHFASSNDCRYPQSELLEAKDGWLYGMAVGGGGHALGGVFRIAKDGTGFATVTGFFRGQPDDPRQPMGGLVQIADGAFYGITKQGGLKNNGTVFRLMPSGALTVLKSLGVATDDVMQPEGKLLLTSDGLLYGTCTLGGRTGGGGIFRLAPDGSRFEVIYHFGTTVGSATKVMVGLVEAPDGSLLGTSFMGGGAEDLGTIFRLGKDGRDYQTLHRFAGGPGDGVRPRSVLTPGGPGVFYGATANGGSAA